MRKITMQPGGSYYSPIEFTIDSTGVVRNEIGRAAMPDMVKILLDRGQITAVEAETTRKYYDDSMALFLQDYRTARAAGPSDEERAEARAAHGPGVTLVDVVTGQRWTT